MSSSAQQAAQVAAGLAFDAQMPDGLTVGQWALRLVPWEGRPRMGLEVPVGELVQLVAYCDQLEAEVARLRRLVER